MPTQESTALEIVTGALGGLPEPVRTSLFKAVSDLLGGLTAIPAAKLKQYAQGIEDTTLARSKVAAAMANAVAAQAPADPILLQAAVEVFLPTALRKAKNRINVAISATEHIAQASGVHAGNAAQPPGDDWMNSFIRFAEDASSERLQDLFGRLLAGEVMRPGAFSIGTLRVLSELDQSMANDFNQVWSKSVGGAVDYGSEWRLGESFSRWKRLSEVGLMAPDPVAQRAPSFAPTIDGLSIWAPIQGYNFFMNLWLNQESSTQWEHIPFTRIGREIGTLLEQPDYRQNLRLMVDRLPKHGMTRVDLIVFGKDVEVLWYKQ